METSNMKKWVRPVVSAMPPKRYLIALFLLLLVFFFVVTPYINRWIYPIKYEEFVRNSAEATGSDPYLVMAIIRVETKFDPNQKSRVGAQGLMQLMPDTVNEAIRKGHYSPSFRDYVNDPATNIEMGSWYITKLVKDFNGNEVVAVAAYNAGPGYVSKWLSTGKWDGTLQHADQIPFGETRHYVQRVFWYYEKYKQVYPELAVKQ